MAGYQALQIGYRLNVPHYSQPTSDTCGATARSMINSFYTLKTTESLPNHPNILALYNAANTDGQAGLVTTELKSAITNMKLVQGWYEEYAFPSDKDAVWSIFASGNPFVVYGNTRSGSAGGHYYVTTGALYCSDRDVSSGLCNYRGLYLNDSVYGSPAYTPPPKPQRASYSSFISYLVALTQYQSQMLFGTYGLIPSKFMTLTEVESYWEKTGSANPFERKHIFLSVCNNPDRLGACHLR